MSRIRTVVWCSADQLELVARVAACDGIELAGVCAVDGTDTARVAQALGSISIDDPRQLATVECDAVWLAADAPMSPETLSLIGARGCSIATALQPATLQEFTLVQRESGRLRGATGPLLPQPAPLIADFLAGGDGAELMRQFGRIDGAAIAVGASMTLGGIGARVLDVADCALRLLGTPETVVAGFVPPAAGVQIREDLRGLAGTLSLQLRTGTCVLAATISTHGGFGRSMTLVGPAGRIEVEGQRLRWLDQNGRVVDELRPRRKRRTPGREPTAAPDGPDAAMTALIAESLRAAAGTQRSAIDLPAALAICEATRLSCRTRVPESPGALRQTLGASPPA